MSTVIDIPKQTRRNLRFADHRQVSSFPIYFPTCNALLKNGRSCYAPTDKSRCWTHQHEYKDLNTKYKRLEESYQGISGDVESLTPDQRLLKAELGEELIKYRQEIKYRFYSNAAQRNRGHIRWILNVKNEVEALQAYIASASPSTVQQSDDEGTDRPSTAESSVEGTNEVGYRSLVHTEIPVEDFKRLSLDLQILAIEGIVSTPLHSAIERLYQLVPELDDGASNIQDLNSPPLSPSEHVWRYMLRGFIAWKDDPDTLQRASQTSNINDFLHVSSFENVEAYCKFFEAFSKNRVDTLHILRDAVRNYLRRDSSSSPQVVILGEPIADGESDQRMTVEGWDLLYQYFTPWMHWHNVESFCTCFEDVVLIKRLIALRRYGDAVLEDGMWDPDQDLSQENFPCLLFGFVPVSKGYCDLPDPRQSQTISFDEIQFRNYVTGRMAKSDPLALVLINELKWRLARYSLIVYEHTSSRRITIHETEDQPWVKRHRSREELSASSTAWHIDLGLDHILGDLRQMRWIRREEELITSYYEFIIIDRLPGHKHTILNELGFILGELAECRSYQEQAHRMIRQCIPETEQQIYMSGINVISPHSHSASIPLDYVHTRVRAWDVEEAFVKSIPKKKLVPQSVARISAILTNLEKHGIVSRLDFYERPSSMPLLVQSTDGNHDLYFPNIDATPEVSEEIWTKAGVPPVLKSSCLHDFAISQANLRPNTIFAKGRVVVPYCAWPAPASPKTCPLFSCPKGYIYRWHKMSFDSIGATRLWNVHLNRTMNDRFSFVLFWNTSFVISADNVEDAHIKLSQVLKQAQKHDLQLEIDPPEAWSNDIDALGLDNPWKGMYPMTYKNL